MSLHLTECISPFLRCVTALQIVLRCHGNKCSHKFHQCLNFSISSLKIDYKDITFKDKWCWLSVFPLFAPMEENKTKNNNREVINLEETIYLCFIFVVFKNNSRNGDRKRSFEILLFIRNSLCTHTFLFLRLR